MAGFFAGNGIFKWVSVAPGDPVVVVLARVALCAVLFTDGMQAGVRDLISAWRLPGRALLIGVPLTFAGMTLAAHYLAQLPWIEGFLVGAILTPTDPVFAGAIVGQEEIPVQIRHLLNVESYVNHGFALPIVFTLLSVAGGQPLVPLEIFGEIVIGIGIGIVIPLVGAQLVKLRIVCASNDAEPLYAFSIALLVFAIASITHANEFLATFLAGIFLTTVCPKLREEFHRFDQTAAELLKLVALLIFGTLISTSWFGSSNWRTSLFILLALTAVRPAVLSLSLWKSGLTAN